MDIEQAFNALENPLSPNKQEAMRTITGLTLRLFGIDWAQIQAPYWGA